MRPKWLAMILLAVLWGLVCVTAMRWQWSKYETRSVLVGAIDTNYSAPAVPLTSVLPSVTTTTTVAQEWSKVTVTGTYDEGRRIFVRNRTQSGGVGFEILVPLRTAGGNLLVDRGWVPNARTAADVPVVPAPPTGTVTVTGWLRAPEGATDPHLPNGQYSSIDTAAAARALGSATYRPYLVLDHETPSAGELTPLDTPTPDMGPYQGYAIQWAIFSVFGFVFIGLGVRAERLAELDTEDRPRPVQVPKPKKVRIWDEEDG